MSKVLLNIGLMVCICLALYPKGDLQGLLL